MICLRKYLDEENEALAIFDETRKPKPKDVKPTTTLLPQQEEKLDESFQATEAIEMGIITDSSAV